MYQLQGKEIAAHPAAELFPLITGAEFTALVESIREHGQREPVVVWREQLLDGRNRLRACQEAGIEPATRVLTDEEIADDAAALAYVLDLNIHRRQLKTSQRALIAARIDATYADAAAERRTVNLKQRTDGPNSDHREVGRSRERAAAAMGVAASTVAEAKLILKHATPEVIAEVEAGRLTINKAAKPIKQRQKEKRIAKERWRDSLRSSGRRHLEQCRAALAAIIEIGEAMAEGYKPAADQAASFEYFCGLNDQREEIKAKIDDVAGRFGRTSDTGDLHEINQTELLPLRLRLEGHPRLAEFWEYVGSLGGEGEPAAA